MSVNKFLNLKKRDRLPRLTSLPARKTVPRFGHWESDSVIVMRKTGGFCTHVERKYLIAFRIDDRQDNAFNKATIQAFSAIPKKLKKSITVDNGKKFFS